MFIDELQSTSWGNAIYKERRAQIYREAFVPQSDDKYTRGQLAIAAHCYTDFALEQIEGKNPDPSIIPDQWIWDKKWWKPSTPERNLVKAGALLLAEHERLERYYAGAIPSNVQLYHEQIEAIVTILVTLQPDGCTL